MIMFNVDIETIEVNIFNGRVIGLSVLFGCAKSLDFLNIVCNDKALVNANFWELLVTLDPSGKLLSSVTGIEISSSEDVPKVLSDTIVEQSVNTGAHQLGHNLGIRHHDSSFKPFSNSFASTSIGEHNATKSFLHTRAAGASIASLLADAAIMDHIFLERSTIKIALSEAKGEIMSEDEAKKEIIELPWLEISNRIILGENDAGKDTICTNTIVITGRLDEFTEVDCYHLILEEGTFLNAEVISHSVFGFSVESVITHLAIFWEDVDGTLVEAITTNTQKLELGLNPVIFNAPITKAGIYDIVVSAPNEIYFPVNIYHGTLTMIPADSPLLIGDYWLLLYILDHEVTDTGVAQEQEADQGHSCKSDMR